MYINEKMSCSFSPLITFQHNNNNNLHNYYYTRIVHCLFSQKNTRATNVLVDGP